MPSQYSTSGSAGVASITGEHRLVAKLTQHLHSNAPILCHINADTSWLILVPIPQNQRSGNGKLYTKILIDPWLEGPQVDYFIWFSVQHHIVPSCVQTIQELENVLKAVEEHEKAVSRASENGTSEAVYAQESSSRQSVIDLVIVSHEFTDHCHKATLLQLHKSTRIVAASAASKLIKSWAHFDPQKITVMPDYGTSFLNSPSTGDSMAASELPPGTHVTRLLTPRDLPQKGFHAGVFITFLSVPQGLPQGIVYSPHGLTPEAVSPLTKDTAHLIPKVLALLHGRVKIDLAYGLMPLNFGGKQGAKVACALQARYWFGTHEEDKKAAGGVSYLLRRKTMLTTRHLEHHQNNTPKFRELSSGEVVCLSAE